MARVVETTVRCAVDARVVRCAPVCRAHVMMELMLPTFPASEPGQFVQLLCSDACAAEPATREWSADGFPSISDEEFAGPRPFLRRPFSIADRWTAPDGSAHLCVLSRTVGVGTRWLERLQPGDILNLTGPLGRGFRLPPPNVALVLVGGGVGIPPFLYLARRLHELGRQDVTAIFGVTTRALLPLRLLDEPAADGTPQACIELPGPARFPAIVTTDDGTLGLRGVVTDALRAWQSRRVNGKTPPMVLACGPVAMLRAVARLTAQLGLQCQLCVERNMGCGIGTCLSCVVRVRDAQREAGWRWALACVDGPVFPRDELLDYSGEAGT